MYASDDNDHYFLIRIDKESRKAGSGYLDIYDRKTMKREDSESLDLPAPNASNLLIM